MAKAKEIIKAAAIMRVSDKSGKFLGFGVKSNSSNTYYHIHCTKREDGVFYTCDCEARQWGHAECAHIKAVKQLVEARRQNELDAAAVVAPLVLSTFEQDLEQHLADEFSAPEPVPSDPMSRPYVHADDALYAALVFGTVNTVAEMCKRADMMEHMVRNSLYHLAAGNRVIVKQIDGERFFVDTPTQGYRTTYTGDFAA